MDIDNGLEKSSILDDSGVMVVESNDLTINNGDRSMIESDREEELPKLQIGSMTKSTSSLPSISEPNNAPQEQFIQLARSAKGAAATQLIKEALEAPGLYVFAELLQMPNIKELSSSPEHSSYYRLMEVFAFGEHDDYVQQKGSLPPLSPVMLTKLRHLTLVSLACKQKSLPLDNLVNKLSLSTRRELEDLIIEAIYADGVEKRKCEEACLNHPLLQSFVSDILHGKLDERNGTLEVYYTIGRDIKPEDLSEIAATLKSWCNSCTGLLTTLDELTQRANKEKETNLRRNNQMEQEIGRIKSTFKRSGSTGEDNDEYVSQTEKLDKKLRLKKLPTGSSSGASTSSTRSKFWPKS